MFPLLPLRILHFPCNVEESLDFILERISKKIPKGFSKHIVSDGQMELILKHKCIFIRGSYHFNTPFCVILQYPQSKREILCQKENNTQSSCMILFSYFMLDGHIFWEAHYLSKWKHNYYRQHVICYSAIQSSV